MTPHATEVLTAMGYLADDGRASDGLVLPEALETSVGDAARLGPLMSQTPGHLAADAVFRVGTSPAIVFKSSPGSTGDETGWHRLAWNAGVAPLLWVTTPQYVRLYNSYQPPESYSRSPPLLAEFGLSDLLGTALTELQAICSRQHVEMGSFWRSTIARKIDRKQRIDGVLLSELSILLRTLVGSMRSSLAQKLVGRCIFLQYLLHRGNIAEAELQERYGARHLYEILTDLDATYSLFGWIKAKFNGDLFPLEDAEAERAQLGHSAAPLAPLADFFGHFSIKDKQGRLFPFRFDAIPIELISSIYEKFVHMSDTDDAPRHGVHYTPINLVDLVLDPVFEKLEPTARVLDPACGSGVFLVESLRRLVWLQTRGATPGRELIRTILLNQVRGVDISPAALSIAAFSLYLTLLELDPDPPRGMDQMDCLRFDPLRGRVLFRSSVFNPALTGRLGVEGPLGFDVIVGNPPWTYNPQERRHDRLLAREEVAVRSDGAEADEDREAEEDGAEADDGEAEGEDGNGRQEGLQEGDEERTGPTYVRLAGLPVPHRSTDWPFLWRCLDFSGPNTRIALVMKATPFFSLDPATGVARQRVLQAFPDVTLLNLSQLRTSRLFQEYASGDEGQKTSKAAGPALIFFSNCLATEPGGLTAINMPWTDSFRRTGVFELSADPPKVVRIDDLQKAPALLKAAMFGTDRDVWFLERLARNPSTVGLGDWCRDLSLPLGQGYQAGGRMPAAHLRNLPMVSAADLRQSRLPDVLTKMAAEMVHRARDPAIFRGPMVLLPEGRLTNTPALGRYTAAYDGRDLAFNRSFVGVSFFGRDPELARALAAVMHSALVTSQVALCGGTVGLKQTKVEAIDLVGIRIPRLDGLPTCVIADLARAAGKLGSENVRDVFRALADIDRTVADASGLDRSDRDLLSDAERRAGAIIFETVTARASMQAAPNDREVEAYARNLCSTFNVFAQGDQDLVLVPDRYASLRNDMLAVRLTLSERAQARPQRFVRGSVDELGPAPLDWLKGGELSPATPSKSLRLYIGQSVYMLKPAQYRYFSPSAGQSDGDRLVAEVMSPGFPADGDAVRQ